MAMRPPLSQPSCPRPAYSVCVHTLMALATLCLLNGCLLFKPYKRDERAASAVAQYLSVGDREVPAKLGEVLAIGPGAMPDLRDSFFASSSSSTSRSRIIHAASTIARPAKILEDVLLSGFQDHDPAVRQVAAFRAGQFPSLAHSLNTSLRALLRDDAPRVRSAAFSSLGTCPAPYALTVTELIRGMHDADFGVAAQAAAIAAKRPEDQLQTESQQALVNLLTALEDPSPAVRAAVAFSFGQFGKRAHAVVTPLSVSMQRETVPEVKLQAALALVRIGTPAAKRAAVPVLKSFAASKHPIFKATALDALKLSGARN
jgi:HEAT repeat protein